MNNKKTNIERKFAQWKEYGEQFTEKEKASYVNGYKRAIQDVIRLARGGKEARLVRNPAMRDTVRAVVEASIHLGIEETMCGYYKCRRNCEYYNPDLGFDCAADLVDSPSIEEFFSMEDGVPEFDGYFKDMQTESTKAHEQ